MTLSPPLTFVLSRNAFPKVYYIKHRSWAVNRYYKKTVSWSNKFGKTHIKLDRDLHLRTFQNLSYGNGIVHKQRYTDLQIYLTHSLYFSLYLTVLVCHTGDFGKKLAQKSEIGAFG